MVRSKDKAFKRIYIKDGQSIFITAKEAEYGVILSRKGTVIHSMYHNAKNSFKLVEKDVAKY